MLFPLKKREKKDLNSTEANDQGFSMWWYLLVEGILEKQGVIGVVTMRMGFSFSREIARYYNSTACKAVH